jgi:hypothetical protein
MPLPEFNEFGDHPEGNHSASLPEVVGRFGTCTAQRKAVTDRLCQISPLVPKLCLGTHSPKLRFAYNTAMTRTRHRIFETEYPYFMTCTIAGWLPVFTRPEAVDIVFDSWNGCSKIETSNCTATSFSKTTCT